MLCFFDVLLYRKIHLFYNCMAFYLKVIEQKKMIVINVLFCHVFMNYLNNPDDRLLK